MPRFLRALFPHPLRGTTAILVITTSIAHFVMLAILHLAPKETAATVFLSLALIPAGVVHGRVWTLITYMFLHDPYSIWHLVFNMFGLYMLGPYVERLLGARRFTMLYFVSGVVGAIVFVLWGLGPGDAMRPAIGASAGVLGVLTAFALLYPESKLYLYFMVPIKAKNLIPLSIGIDLIFAMSDTSIAWQAHMGGMLGAYLYLRKPWNPNYRRLLITRWKLLFSRITGRGRPY